MELNNTSNHQPAFLYLTVCLWMSVGWEHYFKSPGHNTATTLLWRATVVHALSTLVAVPCEPYHARHGAKSHMQHLAAEIIPCSTYRLYHQPTGFNMIQLVSFRLSHPIPINLETQLFLVATVTLVTTCDKHCTVAGSEHTKLTPGVGQVAWDGLPCACGKASALSPGCRRKNGNHMEMYDR